MSLGQHGTTRFGCGRNGLQSAFTEARPARLAKLAKLVNSSKKTAGY
jgi:hypothetical protein